MAGSRSTERAGPRRAGSAARRAGVSRSSSGARVVNELESDFEGGLAEALRQRRERIGVTDRTQGLLIVGGVPGALAELETAEPAVGADHEDDFGLPAGDRV